MAASRIQCSANRGYRCAGMGTNKHYGTAETACQQVGATRLLRPTAALLTLPWGMRLGGPTGNWACCRSGTESPLTAGEQ